jgi:hypothetical protein
LLASYDESTPNANSDSIRFEENAKKILEQYAECPVIVKDAILRTAPDIIKLLEEIPFVLDVCSKSKIGDSIKYTFSKDQKK